MKTSLLAMVIAFSFATGDYSSQINYHQRQIENYQKKVISNQKKVNYHQKKYNDYTMKQAKEMSKK